jgi:two-component system sensor histidine kinase KdpD
VRETFDLRPRRYLLAAAACVAVTIAIWPLEGVLEPTNLIMLYLLAVLGVALRLGRGPAALAAVLSVASFDFFFVSPRFSFAVSDVQYVVTFFVMLVVGLVAGQLVARQRQEAARAREREARTRYLYEMARELSAALLTEQVTDTAARFLKASLNAHIALWLPDEQEKQLVPHSDQAVGSHGDAAIAKWCFDHQQVAGFGSNTLPLAPALYLPLKAPMRTRGVLAVLLADTSPLRDPDNRRLCEAVAALIAQTLERLHYIEVAQHTLLSMESERLRHSLLAALSHDLRTPLTALSGTAELLARQLGSQSNEGASDEAALAWNIVDQSRRTTRLVTNLLEMARLQAGGVVLQEDWLSAEELVGSALTALDGLLTDRTITLDIPADYPLLFGDAVLLERVLVNLLENAAKYSPAGSEIGIDAGVNNGALDLTVWDHGPGLPPGDPERLFAPFSRGERESAIAGVGLGLAICRTIAEVHHGKLTAANGLNGGARFTLSLPLKPQPELDPLAEESLS